MIRKVLILAWFAGFVIVGQWLFDPYYGRICRRYGQQLAWEYDGFNVGGRRSSASCHYRVPSGDGQTERRHVPWSDIPRSTLERILVFVPYVAGFLYFLPLIWLVASMGGQADKGPWRGPREAMREHGSE